MRFLFLSLLHFGSLAQANVCTSLPAQFEDNRIYLEIKTPAGEVLKFYTDSGGGLFPFFYKDTAEKLALKTERTEQDGETTVGYTSFPQKLFIDQGIPIDSSLNGKVRVFTYKEGSEDEASQLRFMLADGFFGASFFANKIWKFIYLKGQLSSCLRTEASGFAPIPMAFKMTKNVRDTHQPRIEIEIDGEKFPMLFDTGATSLYSKEAVNKLKPLHAYTASSFIRESVAKRWKQSHPQWKVIKAGEKFAGGGDLIEVPLVRLASYSVGPIWFATRRDDIYDQYSKDYMDSRIEGAVGGNLFRYFTLIADYPNSKLLVKPGDH